ncbi:MAG: hypothetical protein WB729_09640 [Candidatus Sulfotelmatobacter sp.]
MAPVCLRIIVLVMLVTFWVTAPAQQSGAGSPPSKDAPLSLDEVVRNLQQRNAQRAAALEEFSGTRIYRMEYRGLPGDRDAQMVVHTVFNAPDSRKFTVLSESGSKFVIDHVFKRLLDGEQEAANPQNRRLTALSTENYDFAWAGYESTPEGARYVLSLLPKSRNKFLYRGKIWVDAQDFAVVRIEGEPAKNPSFWIKKTEIKHRYIKVNDFWLPAENHTESVIRLGGRATLTIEYRDYKITKSLPVTTSKSAASKPLPQATAK